ncbi:hypothetical protein CDAR_564361 [Caerostris darwini]|uniref:Uncharacterized protein n=1 Tax=Caerostris darwini TaxID=1538125 RepID=A0AAV4TJX0_9ARAC|nr:hypothetical protein CDAR_564361 [Caerostris darwini]
MRKPMTVDSFLPPTSSSELPTLHRWSNLRRWEDTSSPLVLLRRIPFLPLWGIGSAKEKCIPFPGAHPPTFVQKGTWGEVGAP